MAGQRVPAGPLPRAWPLVGRGQELDLIAGAIGDADLSGVVLAGEPGVGKTRLATESLAIAERVGFGTARAIATRAASSIPLGALAPLLAPTDARADLRHDAIQEAVEGLTTRSDEQPFMLLVDDAHLLDDASATVLHHLAVGSPVFVVATVRVGEPEPDPVAAIWKDDLAHRIDIGPLRRPDVERLLLEVLGASIDGATLADLWWASRGNPLFLRELVTGALEAGFLIDDGGVWRMRASLAASPRLVELVEARLADLDEPEWAALEILAFGEPLPITELTSLIPEPVAESLDRRGLLTLDMVGRRREVRLAHPIHGEVIRERTRPLRAMAVQRRLAETMQEAGVRRENALRVAVWTLESDGEADPELMLTAARQALFAHDEDLSERLARVAVEDGVGADGGQILGEALYRQGRHAEAVEALGRVVGDAVSDDQRALVALSMAEALFNGLGRLDEAEALLSSTEAAITDAGWQAEFLALRGAYRLLGGDPRGALALVEPLLRAPHPRAFVVAGTVAGPALAVMGRCDESIDVADRAFAAHIELGAQQILAHPGIHLVARALALGEAGRFEEAEATARAGYEGAVGERAREGQAWFALIRARTLWLTDLVEAIRWFREGAAVFGRLGYGGQRRWCLAGGALVAAHRGDVAAARALLAAVAELPSEHIGMMLSDVERAYGWVEVAEGGTATSLDRFRHAADIAAEAACPALEAAALHDRARLGEAAEVADRLERVAAQVDGHLAAGRARHASALAGGRPGAVEAAAAGFEEIGALVLAAEAFAQASKAWRDGGEPRRGDRCAQQASRLAEGVGGLETPAMRLSGEAAVLTARELEVATLAANGLTNKQIAAQLVLSVRTVGNHLQRVYEKLGVGGREELRETIDARG